MLQPNTRAGLHYSKIATYIGAEHNMPLVLTTWNNDTVLTLLLQTHPHLDWTL